MNIARSYGGSARGAALLCAGSAVSLTIGVALPRWPLYTIAAIGAVTLLAVAIRDLALGVAVLAFASLLEQVPALATREVTVVKLVGAVLAVAWLVRLAVSMEARDVNSRTGVGVRKALMVAAGLAFWSLLSTLWASDASVATSNGARLGQGILLLFIACSALRTSRDASLVLGAFVAGALTTTLIGFATAGSTGYTQWGEVAAQRLTGLTGDPNELGAQLVPALMLCLVFALAPVQRSWRVGAVGASLLLLGGITATVSRGAIVGLAGALVLAPLIIRGLRVRTALVSAAAVGVAIALVSLTAPPALAKRLWVFSDGGTGRSDLWRVALKMTEDHPVLGVGAGNFPIVAPSYAQTVPVSRPDLVYTDPHVVHNTYLQFFAETGAVGGLMFLAIVALALRRARDAVRMARSVTGRAAQRYRDALLIRAVFIATVGYLGSLFFISGAYEKPLWLFLAVCLRLPSLARAAVRDTSVIEVGTA